MCVAQTCLHNDIPIEFCMKLQTFFLVKITKVFLLFLVSFMTAHFKTNINVYIYNKKYIDRQNTNSGLVDTIMSLQFFQITSLSFSVNSAAIHRQEDFTTTKNDLSLNSQKVSTNTQAFVPLHTAVSPTNLLVPVNTNTFQPILQTQSLSPRSSLLSLNRTYKTKHARCTELYIQMSWEYIQE